MISDNNASPNCVFDVKMTDNIFDKADAALEEVFADYDSAINKIIGRFGKNGEIQNDSSFDSILCKPLTGCSETVVDCHSSSDSDESSSPSPSHLDEDEVMSDVTPSIISSDGITIKSSFNDAQVDYDSQIIKPAVNDDNTLLHAEHNIDNLMLSETEMQLIKVETPEVKLNELAQNTINNNMVEIPEIGLNEASTENTNNNELVENPDVELNDSTQNNNNKMPELRDDLSRTSTFNNNPCCVRTVIKAR